MQIKIDKANLKTQKILNKTIIVRKKTQNNKNQKLIKGHISVISR